MLLKAKDIRLCRLLAHYQVTSFRRVRTLCTITKLSHRTSPAFVLTIKTTPEDVTPQTFFTSDVQNLQKFSGEYRRLKEIASKAARCWTYKLMIHITSHPQSKYG